MSDVFKPESPDTAGTSVNEISNAAIHNLPLLSNAINASTPATAQNQFDIISKYLPQYNSLMTNMAVQNQNTAKQAGATSDLALLNGTGADLIRRVEELDKGLNPQWYSARDQATKGASDILGSYNLNGLSGGESAAIERASGMNNFAGGNGFAPNQLTTIGNAMDFGAGYDRKRSNMSAAVNNLTSTANAFKSPIDPLSTVFGRSSTNAPIANPMLPDPMAASNQNTQLASALLGVGSAANTARTGWLSSANNVSPWESGTNAVGDIAGMVGSF